MLYLYNMSIKVHHLNCATLCPLTGTMVCHCLLLETNEGLILIDTGLGTKDILESKKRLDYSFRKFVKPVLNMEETALYQIQKLGYQSDDVKRIVLTHLHVDHAGGITDFPKAKVHVLRHEYNNIYNTEKILQGYNINQFKQEIQWQIHDIYGEKWNGFNKSNILEKNDDIVLVPLRGHTSGHCGIAINSDKGWLFHCGDAYFHKDTIKSTPSHTPLGIKLFQYVIDYNSDVRIKNQTRLYQLYHSKKQEIQMICSHDINEFNACTCGKNPNFI